MEIDLFEATVRVLEEGLDAVGKIQGQKTPVATWKKGLHGAVLFVGPWREDDWDGICAVTSKDADGRWQRPLDGGWAGGSWYNPFERQEIGWHGQPVAWQGGVNLKAPDGTLVRAMHGIAARSVAAIEVKRYSEQIEQVVPIDSPHGCVIVGVTDDDSYVLTALDSEGRPVRRQDDSIALELLEAPDREAHARRLARRQGAAVAVSVGSNEGANLETESGQSEARSRDERVLQGLEEDARDWTERLRRRNAEKRRRGG